jgi:hypothetical protein
VTSERFLYWLDMFLAWIACPLAGWWAIGILLYGLADGW